MQDGVKERRELLRTALAIIGNGLIDRLRDLKEVNSTRSARPGGGTTETDSLARFSKANEEGKTK